MSNRTQIDAPPIAPPKGPLAEPTAHATVLAFVEQGCDSTADNDASNRSDRSTATLLADSPPKAGDPLSAEAIDPLANPPTGNTRVWRSYLELTPAALISLIVHTALLILLALWTVSPSVGILTSNSFELATGESDDADALDQPVEILASGDSMAAPADLVSDMPNSGESSELRAESVLQQTFREMQKIDPSAPKMPTFHPSLSSAFSKANDFSSIATLAATGVDGRSAENREQTAKARGGTLESELAVERALEWLAAHQLPNGSWSLTHDGGKCNGRCKNNGSNGRFEPAATGLALLAFLGAGYTHKSGKHQKTVHDGVYYLLQIMEEVHNAGSFLHQSERGMYNHGIAAFALCEAYQLSGDQDLRKPAQLAINFICAAQNYAGGWGYLPKQPGDLTITGWQMMAIKSAHAAELDVPPSVILRIDNFLETKQLPPGIFYGYAAPEKDPTCSSIGVLLRLFRGWSHTDPRALELAQFLVKRGRSNGDVYFNYYATLLLFHLGGPAWETWNPNMREHLVKTQNQSGHEAGSWYFEDQYAKEGGRVYTTAMCAMTLEVYYRFAPLYQQADRPFEL